MRNQLEKLTSIQRKYLAIILVSAILLFMFFVMLFSSRGIFNIPADSGTVDEIAHIPAGYSYIKYGDFRLNPEHPPLAKALAGFPLLFQKDISGPKDDWSWEGINQWEAGWYMLYEAGNDPAEILFWTRLPIILLTIGLGLFLYKWAAELYGRKVGLLVLTLFAFYPDIIAHGRLVTTDIAAAFGFVVAIYFFDKMLQKPTARTIIFAALIFALAQLLKFSAFLLFIILFLIVLFKAFLERKEKKFWPSFWQYFKYFFLVCVLSVIFVWIVYIPFVWNTPASVEHEVIERNLTSNPDTLALRNFLHSFENNPITRGLGHYLLGIMLVVGRVEGGNATFILGQLSDKSISWYFPVTWLLKTSISIIIFTFWALIAFLLKKGKSTKEVYKVTLFLIPIAIYWAVTLKGSLNIGIRHLLPTVPFVLLLIGYLFNQVYSVAKITYKKVIVIILMLFMIISTLLYFPHYISYFNEFVPKNERYNYLTDSSLDWGQDLLRLKQYIDENNIDEIKIDYFGGSVPDYYISQAVDWHSSYGPTTGWLAISATFYQSSKLYGEMEGKWSYEWLDEIEPTAIIGGSILVFNIPENYLKNNTPVSSYPIKELDFPGSIKYRKVGL